MKLATVEAGGVECFGAIVEGGFIDFSKAFGDKCADLVAYLRSGVQAEAQALCNTAKPDYATSELEFLPVNNRSDMRMFALGWSYKSHQLETGKEGMEFPVVFSKLPQSLVGHGRSLVKPRPSEAYDFEGEIAIIVGKAGKNVPAEKAFEHIGGWSLVMDGSARDFQQHSITAGKNFDRSSAFGPWMVTADEIDDPKRLVLMTRLNGQEVQHAGFDLMAWDLGFLFNYLSTIAKLEVGDVISTGTPAGVGNRRTPKLFMKAGDVIEVEVPSIGVLRNQVETA